MRAWTSIRSDPPRTAALYQKISMCCMQICILLLYIPSTVLTFVRSGQFYLYAVDSVDAINEKNEDKDKSNLTNLSITTSEKKDMDRTTDLHAIL